MTPVMIERTEVVELSRDEIRSAAEQLGQEIYGIANMGELLQRYSTGQLEDRPGSGHLLSLLDMAA